MTWTRFPHYWPFVKGIHMWLWNTELWYLFYCYTEQFLKQAVELLVNWNSVTPILRLLISWMDFFGFKTSYITPKSECHCGRCFEIHEHISILRTGMNFLHTRLFFACVNLPCDPFAITKQVCIVPTGWFPRIVNEMRCKQIEFPNDNI